MTLDPANRVAAAIAVRAGRILAVGTEAQVHAAVLRNARVVDLAGHTMLPGLFAAHDHLPQSGLTALFQVDLNSPPMGVIATMDQLIAALQSKAQRTRAGEWIVGRGYDDTLLRVLELAPRRRPAATCRAGSSWSCATRT